MKTHNERKLLNGKSFNLTLQIVCFNKCLFITFAKRIIIKPPLKIISEQKAISIFPCLYGHNWDSVRLNRCVDWTDGFSNDSLKIWLKTCWVSNLWDWFFLWVGKQVEGLKNPSFPPHAQ